MAKAVNGQPDDPTEREEGWTDAITGGDAGDPAGEEDDGQLFVLEQDKRVTLGTLYKRGTPVEFRVVLGSKSVPGDGGLISFSDPDLVLVVPARAGAVRTEPTYRDDGTLSKVTVYATMKPLSVHDSRSPAALEALGALEPAAG